MLNNNDFHFIPEDDVHLIGLSNFRAVVRENVPFEESEQCIVHNSNGGHIQLTRFPPGAVIGFKWDRHLNILDVSYVLVFLAGDFGQRKSFLTLLSWIAMYRVSVASTRAYAYVYRVTVDFTAVLELAFLLWIWKTHDNTQAYCRFS